MEKKTQTSLSFSLSLLPLGERDIPNIVVVVERSGCLVYKHAVMVSDSFWNFLFFRVCVKWGGWSAGGSRIRETGAEVIGANVGRSEGSCHRSETEDVVSVDCLESRI